ncbi:MAG TPA: Uma2 family endonuclease [Abditibacterium sp.]|jgi:Uma2 family endonuclease
MSAQRKYVDDFVDEASYFVLAEKSDVRLEYVDGFVRAMAGTSRLQANINSRILAALATVLRDGPCEVVASDLRIRPAGSTRYYYPDIAVYCENAEFDENAPNTLLSPTILVEVLSDSTAHIDRTEKLDVYLAIPTLRHYLMVDQSRVRIEHFHRAETAEWHFDAYLWRRDTISFPDLNVSIPVEEIYRRLDLPEGFILMSEDTE